MNPFLFACSVYFLYYLINHSGPVSDYILQFTQKLPDKVQYALNCSFCFGFWGSLFVIPLTPYAFWWILVVPVFNLFINLLYLSLTQ